MNTPLTDASCYDSLDHQRTIQNCEVVTADFARKLERDRARLIEYVQEVQNSDLLGALGKFKTKRLLDSLEADKSSAPRTRPRNPGRFERCN